MVRRACGAPSFRAPFFKQYFSSPQEHLSRQHRYFRPGIAGLLATSVLVASPVAHARTTQIQILTRGLAFGGHSFAGIGQYEFITGIATGEVDPKNPQNALITD